MTTYVSVSGTASYNRAKYKPHDKRAVRIVRNSHNAAVATMANAVQVNMFTIPADSVLLGVWTEVTGASAVANCLIDVGVSGAPNYAANLNSAATGVVQDENLLNIEYANTAKIITLAPNNGNAWVTGTIQVTAAYIELDSFGVNN